MMSVREIRAQIDEETAIWRNATMVERERCAKIADQRAELWGKRVEAGVHGKCAMSLLEECEDIAAAIRRQSE